MPIKTNFDAIFANSFTNTTFMKRLSIALACLIGMIFLAGCTQDQISEFLEQKPNVAFVEAEGYTSSNVTVLAGTELNFQIKVSPNAGSASPLAHLNFVIADVNGHIVRDVNHEIEDPTGESIIFESFSTEKASTYLVTATVTDEAGKANIAELTVGYLEPIVAEIGVFKGKVNITGRVTTDGGIVAGMGALNEPLDIGNIATEITLGSTEAGKINAMIYIDGTPVVFQATPDGDHLAFDEFNFNTTIDLYNVAITLNITINMDGVLAGDTLTLDGTAYGYGEITVVGVKVHVNLNDGVIDGVLEKTE